MEEITAKFSLEQNEPLNATFSVEQTELKASFTAYNEPPSIVIEGTGDYNELENKPSINDVELEGNKTLDELGIQEKGDYALKIDIPAVDGLVTETQLQQGLETRQEKGDYALKEDIPTLVSELENDSNYATQTQVMQAIASIPQFKLSIVNELPLAGEKMTLYLVPKEGTNNDVYDEYIWIEETSSFEHLGTTAVDLTDYVKKTDYATIANAGVIVANSYFGAQTNTFGQLMATIRTLLDYQTANPNSLISKGTLENIKNNYVKEAVTANDIELTDDEKANAQAWLGIEGGGSVTADTSSTLVVPANYGIKSQNSSGLATSKTYYNFSSCHTVNLIQKQLSTGNIYTGVSTPVLRLQQDGNNYVEMNITGYVLSFNLVIGGTKLRTVSFGQSDNIWKALIGAHSWVLTFDYIQKKFFIHTRGTTTASNGSFTIDMSEWELDQLGNFQIVTEMGTGYTTVLGSKFLVLNSYININTYLDTKLTSDNYSPFGVSYVGTQTNANNYTLKVDGTRLETISPTHVINSYNLEATNYFAMGLNGGANLGTGSVMVTKIRFNEITTETKLYEGASTSRILVLDDDFKPITTLATNTAFIPEVNKWYTLVADLRRDSGYGSLYSYRLMGAGTVEVKGLFISHPQYMGLGSLNWNGEYFTGYIPFKGRAIKFEQITSMLVPPLYQQKIVDGNIQMWNGSAWKQISN